MASIGKQFVSAVLEGEDIEGFLKLGNIDHLFRPTEKELHEFIKTHVYKHGQLPAAGTLEDETGEELPEVEEPPSYYYERLKNRHMETVIKKTNADVKDLMQPGSKDPQAALKVMMDSVMDIAMQQNSNQIVDFRQAYDILWPEYVSKNVHGDIFGLSFGWPSLDDVSGGAQGGDLISLVGRPQMGKAQPLTEPVLMADGVWKDMGLIEVGDALASVDGKPSKVMGVFPQGVRPVYRVTFSDGRHTDVDQDHLWQVRCDRWVEKDRVINTTDLKKALEVKRNSGRIKVPLVSGDFGESELPIDPYVLGVLLGDGCFKHANPSLTGMDVQIADRVASRLPEGVKLNEGVSDKRTGCRIWYIVKTEGEGSNLIKQGLKSLGLLGFLSIDKYIPEVYLRACREDRISILQGLMDTDGWAETFGATRYCSSSEKLAKGVQELVWSLGGLCSARRKQTTHKDTWILGIRFENPKELFSLDRKQERVNDVPRGGQALRLGVVSVEPLMDAECQCIQVSHDSSLYVTRDYIVTHNTFVLLYIAMHVWWKLQKPVIFFSMEMKPNVIMQRLAAMRSSVNLTGVQKAFLSSLEKARFKKGMTQVGNHDHPFYIVDGNLTSTVDECYMMCRQLGPHAVFVDGAYLMKHPDKRLNRYARVAENCELLKQQIASELDVPTYATWQFSRDAVKKSNEKIGLEDIGYTDVIGQISSIVLGLLQDDSVETLKYRFMEILKGRNGETGQFPINWDFFSMDFSEMGKSNTPMDHI